MGRHSQVLEEYLTENGYEQDRGILVAAEGRRWTLSARDNTHKLDVFFDQMEFTHRLIFRERISVDQITLPVADLLLAKLQHLRPSSRDMTAIVLLLAGFPLGDADGPTLNTSRVTAVLSSSWGYNQTASANLERATTEANGILQGSPLLARRATESAQTLLSEIANTPKPASWRLRALVGTRIKWYNDVEQGDIF